MARKMLDIFTRENGDKKEYRTPSWEKDGSPPPKVMARGIPVLPKYLRRTAIALAIVLVAIGGFYVVGFIHIKKTVAEVTPAIYREINEAKKALEELDLREAKSSLESIHGSISSIHADAVRYQLLTLANLWGTVVPKIKLVPQTFAGVIGITESAITATTNLEELKESGLSWLMNREGEKFASVVQSLSKQIANISDLNSKLSAHAAALEYALPEEILGADIELYRTERFVKTFADWIQSDEEKRILVLFQNQTEIRPGGGFIGSYADVTLDKSGVKSIVVNDVYPADREMEKIVKIIPPKELRGITPLWGARDGSWFFDFPTSAEKVASLFERSPLYRNQNMRFDAVIGMNVKVMESIISTIGEIPLPEYDMVINRTNFLPEIQREVETGEDNRLLRKPKKVLGVLAPKIFEAVGSFSDEQKKIIAKAFADHFAKKDIMLYSRNLEFQNFFENANVSGSVYELEKNRPGEYLAVVNANVAGGKADAFIKQTIKLSAKIDETGAIDNYLTIERTHSGEKEKDWWYKATDWNYLKVFTPRASRLIYATGNDERDIKELVNYKKEGYLIDPEIEQIEKTRKETQFPGIIEQEEFDKTVFGTWFSVKAGTSKKIAIQYVNPTKLNLESEDATYSLVFEKQSGANTTIELLVQAPKGFHWKENGQTAFNYFESDPAGRVKVTLTLAKD